MKVNWMTCVRVGVTVLVLYVIIHYWDKVFQLAGMGLGAAMPLLAGCVIAYVVNILMGQYEIFFEKLFLRKKNVDSEENTQEVSVDVEVISQQVSMEDQE